MAMPGKRNSTPGINLNNLGTFSTSRFRTSVTLTCQLNRSMECSHTQHTLPASIALKTNEALTLCLSLEILALNVLNCCRAPSYLCFDLGQNSTTSMISKTNAKNCVYTYDLPKFSPQKNYWSIKTSMIQRAFLSFVKRFNSCFATGSSRAVLHT